MKILLFETNDFGFECTNFMLLIQLCSGLQEHTVYTLVNIGDVRGVKNQFLCPPTLEKLRGHIGLALSVHLSVPW